MDDQIADTISGAKKYCNSITEYSRLKTREVNIGDVLLGGNNPIRIQSMTTTDTMDTEATVAQSIRMIKAGCEYVRITAPSKNEAENLQNINDELRKKGYDTPLIADIHFTPNAAEIAATIVEKVRINPGNYADKKKFEQREYSEEEYNAELERIRDKFVPLVNICKEHGTAIRIGTNHGSLSDRIMNRYGDTPLGMVESALEFVRICEENDFRELVLSMKASNPQVMVQANRLLVHKMREEGMNYPIHLGVTEAGESEDGRIKSAIGIGTLLEDGIGDTVRVSLTEEPENEIPVAQLLVDRYKNRKNDSIQPVESNPINPFEYNRRNTRKVLNIGGDNVPVVMADYCLKKEITPTSFASLGYHYSEKDDKWAISDTACDYVFVGANAVEFEVPGLLGIICNYKIWLDNCDRKQIYPFLNKEEYLNGSEVHPELNIVYCTIPDLDTDFIEKLKSDTTATLLIDTCLLPIISGFGRQAYNPHGMAEQRRLFIELMNNHCDVPVIIGRAYGDLTEEQLLLNASCDIGGLLIDGLGDGIFLAAENCGSDQFITQTAFGILQATCTRISKTEYISCPSCGRTLFDLQETTAKIRTRTGHLKGLKIGIMGCIVNGPGEMADADYGYVGTGQGKITLYRKKEVVRRNIPESEAVDALIDLIKKQGDWVEDK